MRLRALLATAVAAALLAPAPAQAHPEREGEFPSGAGEVPTYRADGPYLLVCKNRTTLSRIRELPPKLRAENLALFRECRRDGFRHVQEAVDDVRRPGTRILILPGVYRERPSLRPQPPECQALPEGEPPHLRAAAAVPAPPEPRGDLRRRPRRGHRL